jgi:hypothetical protein
MPEQKLEATAAPYFDNSCGMISFRERWKEDWDQFLNNKNYATRDFIVKTLSPSSVIKIWEGKIHRLK